MNIIIKNEETAKNGIIAIGQSLIERAEEITRDLDRVASITIFAQLNPSEITNFDNIKYEKDLANFFDNTGSFEEDSICGHFD